MNAKDVKFVIVGVPTAATDYVARTIVDELQYALRQIEARMHWKRDTLSMRAEVPSMSAAERAMPPPYKRSEPDAFVPEDLLCADADY